MAAPIATDLVIYGGLNGVPANATGLIGGAVGAPLSSASLGADLGTINRGASNQTYYAIFYFQNNCTYPSYLNFARIYNRSGALRNATAGSLTYVSTANDVTTILTTGKVGGVFAQELVTLTGTTSVSGTRLWDINSIIRHESLATGTTPVKCIGNVSVTLAGSILAVLYGTASNPAGQDLSTITASAEFSFALATNKNTVLSSANRITLPTGIGAFFSATYWAGGDASLGISSATLGFGEYVGVCVAYQSLAGAFEPISNELDHFPVLLGSPVA